MAPSRLERADDAPIRVRSCERADLGVVSAIEVQCFGAESSLPRLALTQYLDLGGPLFVVAEQAEAGVIGFAVGGLSVTAPHDGWILDVATHPAHRGRGVGLTLCRELLDRLRGVGATAVRATVSAANVGSRAMFDRLGFDVEREDDAYFGPGEGRRVVVWRSARC